MVTVQDDPGCRTIAESAEPQEGNYFVSTYPPFSTWTKEHVCRVRRVLEAPPHSPSDAPLGLYVHIPFCVKRCDYCYYLSYAGKSPQHMEEYVNRLIEELAMYGTMPALAGRKLSFVYFGGGTPSLLTTRCIRRLMRQVQSIFPWTDVQEATFECAPQTVTQHKLSALREAGITRVSLGVQSLNDDVLRLNGRVHLVRDIERAYAAIRRAGFDVVNIDLMAGLVGQTGDSFHEGLGRVIAMQPESVTIYPLEIPHNTPLYRAMRDGTLATPPATWDAKRAWLVQGFTRLEQAGYAVRSAYAAVRDPQQRGFVYQDAQYRGADLVGIGAASFSYVAGTHYQNLASFDTYLASMTENELPVGRAYVLSDEERLIREFVLQLKLGATDAGYFRNKFGADIADRFTEPLTRFAECGWLEYDEQGVRLTRDGLVRVDRLIPAFYLPQHRGLRYT